MRSLALALGLLCTASVAAAQSPERGARSERSVLREGELWLSPILRVRERGEIRLGNYEYLLGDPPLVDDLDRFRVEHRVWMGADARWRNFRAVLVLRDARRFGQTGQELATTDLYQAFGELTFDEGWLRVGRQEIRWGNQRLISAAPWGPGISFDAVRGRVDLGGISFDAFGAWLLSQPGGFGSVLPNTEHPGRLLFGLRAMAVVSPALVLEPTVLYRYDGFSDHNPSPGGLGGLGNLEEPHLGTGSIRMHGVAGGFVYDLEAMAQIGEEPNGGDVHLAFAGAGWAGYRFAGALGFELRGGGSFGTGPSDDLDTFDNLFPANHARYGIIDYASLANMGSASCGSGPRPKAPSSPSGSTCTASRSPSRRARGGARTGGCSGGAPPTGSTCSASSSTSSPTGARARRCRCRAATRSSSPGRRPRTSATTRSASSST